MTNTNEMKTLTQYKKNGIDWQITSRAGNIAMATSERGYEVIIIQSHNGRTIACNYCEPAEYPPSNEQWGSKGWSYTILADAENKYSELTK